MVYRKSNISRMTTVLVLGLMAAVLQGCATTGNSMPTAEKLVEMGIVNANADLASLDRGRIVAMMDCRECHRVYWPQEYSHKRWPRIAKNMGHLMSMDDQEIKDLTDYLVAASKTPEFEENRRKVAQGN